MKKVFGIYEKNVLSLGVDWVGTIQEDGSSVAHDINKHIMLILGLLFIALIVMSLVYGLRNHLGIELVFEINMLSSPYHQFGISFFGENNKTHLVETLSIGLIFINVVLVFYKKKEQN